MFCIRYIVVEIVRNKSFTVIGYESVGINCYQEKVSVPWVYVFSTFRSQMAKTKVTPRKLPICPMCKTGVAFEVRFEDHLKDCEKTKEERDKVTCETFGVVFKNVLIITNTLKIYMAHRRKAPTMRQTTAGARTKIPTLVLEKRAM
ncbi:hypothetical protein DPMN_173552 [Dreissena polymorpha]|uniref:Uncharacterized protein n=1 Tax=Dreissena polymorpha TaxID=45954 RepID=A0A9D4E4U7_DREPO|nr:hypothetical protein DPMN_173552 [Dreissena polymorpha]